jgi:hypothetical protein
MIKQATTCTVPTVYGLSQIRVKPDNNYGESGFVVRLEIPLEGDG